MGLCEEESKQWDIPRSSQRSKRFAGWRTTWILSAGVFATVSLAIPSFSQSPLVNSANDLTQMPIPGSGHDYQQLLGETINFSNGSVSFRITFPTPPSRGISIPYRWSYNSAAVNTLDSLDGVTPFWNQSAKYYWPKKDGWNLADGTPWGAISFFQQTPPTGPPNMNLTPCNYLSGITFTDTSGVLHNLPTAAVAPASNGLNDFHQCSSTPLVLPPAGDSQAVAVLFPRTGENLIGGSGVGYFLVLDKNGTIYNFSLSVGTQTPSNNGGAETIEDRNGNEIVGGVDTSGRAITVTGSPATSVVTEGQTYSATWSTVSVSYSVPFKDGRSPSSMTLCQPFQGTVSTTKNVLSTLTLPNGRKYQFFYNNNYGLLSEVIFPDGGWIKYSYEIPSGYNEELDLAGWQYSGDTRQPVSYGCMWQYQTPVLSQRTVSFDGATVAQTQQFTYTTNWQFASDGSLNNWSNKTTTVTTTDNKRGLTAKVEYLYSFTTAGAAPFLSSQNAAQIPQENTITYYDWGSASPTKVVKKTWVDMFTLQSETTTLYTSSGSVTSGTYFNYTSGLCNNALTASFKYLVEQDDYDFGAGGSPGPILKRTKYNYACFRPSDASTYSSYSSDSAPSNWGSTYEGILVPPKLSSAIVEDGSGNILAATQYNYDEPNSMTVQVSPTHYDTAYNNVIARGNLTSVLQCNPAPTSESAGCSSGSKTTYTYDFSGQPVSVIDPRGNTTQFSFADSFSDTSSAPSTNSYLTSIKYPSVNGITLQKSFKYSYVTGYLTQAVDENSGTTNYIYNDSLSRLTETDLPDGGQTKISYDDSGNNITTSRLVDSGTNLWQTDIAHRDGMGHTTQTQLTSDPNGTDIVDMSYDGEGLIYTKSNPHRSGSATTDGTTTYVYDALGRKTQTTLPDSAVSTISYAGNAMKVTDPPNGTTSVQHIYQVDGLGRQTRVCEVSSSALGADAAPSDCGLNIAGSGYLTSYGFDALGNLTSVNQHGLSRSFVYDSLSHLKTASNPEVGTVQYTYSVPGNVCAADPSLPCTRQDARGVVTSYQYDSLNRLTGRSYSVAGGNTTGPISDLSSCYNYDVVLSGVSDSNPKGRLTAEWQQSGSCPVSSVSSLPSGAVAIRIPSMHDAMGRVGRDQQCLTTSGCPADTGSFVYTYNKLGSPKQANNGIRSGTVSEDQVATSNNTSIAAPSVTWKAVYDGAPHLTQVFVQDQPSASVWPVSSVGAAFSNAPTLLQGISYDPLGNTTIAQLGIPYGSLTPPLSISRQYDSRGRIQTEGDQGTLVSSLARGSTGSITISGSEQSRTQNGTSATATISISGSEQSNTHNTCPPQYGGCPVTIYDSGSDSIVVNGITAGSFSWSQGSSGTSLATALASSINGNSNSPVSASTSGSVVTLTSKIQGSGGNYGISVTSGGWNTTYFSSPSFTVSAPSALTGGTNGSTTYDSGTVSATINSHTATVSWGNGSSSSSVASALASAINSTDGSFLTATSSGGIVSLTSTGTGSSTNWSIQMSVTYDSGHFSSASYSAASSGMSGGADAGTSYGTIYSYQVPSGGYAPNGNVLQHMDSVMGTWNFSYDAVDRLMTAQNSATTSTSTQYAGMYGCWKYDTRGNRTMEALSSANCSSNPTPQVLSTYNSANNQISSSTLSPNTVTPGSFLYDASGNTIYDGLNEYWYDAEGQLCAVQSKRYGNGPVIQYVYDATGARIAKGTLSSAPGTYATCAPPSASGTTLSSSAGLALSSRYLVDQGGQQVTELNGSGTWQHSNIWVGGKLVATYDLKGIHFQFTDPLGTKRVQANAAGQTDERCTSLPFGNDLNNPPNLVGTSCIPVANPLGTSDDATEHHFTSRERDAETGNDYLLARYYTSALGRFMSPDWSATVEPVPYSKLDNPQTLNLYAYVYNNPLKNVDPDGHLGCGILWLGNCPKRLAPPPLPPKPPALADPRSHPGQLASAQEAARNNPKFAPTGERGTPERTTHCNQATCNIVKNTGAPTNGLVDKNGNPNLANTDAKTLANSPDWGKVDPQTAQDLATLGVTVLGVRPEDPHGHIVTVAPEMLPGDQNVQKYGPLINNIGGSIGVTNANNVFRGTPATYYAPTTPQW